MRSNARHRPAPQRGIALLGLLALLSAVVIFAYVTGLNRSAAGMAQVRAQKTSLALAQAKEALIAYAVTYKDTHDDPGNSKYYVPGYLPCPDLGPASNVEGTAAGNCGGFLVSSMGRLPWKTLRLDVLKDGADECLWYAVSGTYKNSPNGVTNNNATATSTTSNNLMNWDTNGQFNVMDASGTGFLAGSAEDNRAVAVIFAPGAALPGQDRTPVAGTSNCGGNFNAVPPAAAYLESANGINNGTLATPSSPTSVADVSSFIAGAASSSFNDQLVYITRADIWNAIKKRSDFNNYLRALTRRAAECTAMYGTRNGAGDKRLPWASSVFMANLSYYAVDRRYRDVGGTMSGRLSYRVTSSVFTTFNALAPGSDPNLGSYSSYLLLSSANVVDGSYCAYAADEKAWYDNWKDHLFYALAARYAPWYGPSMVPCDNTICLQISNTANTQTYANYAAVVIFAGEKLAGQSRNTLSDKSQISNYLEGRNAGNDPNSSGNANYEGAGASGTFNDIVYAIDENLTVSCYVPSIATPGTGTMVAAPSAACP